jgi:WD40 repeat protein
MKETDLNTLSVSADKQVIAVGDSLGRVRILNYPAFNIGQASLKLESGHANGVSSVLFTPGGLRQ